MKIIELEQELRIQKASMASMNVVPNNIGQNSVETMSAFAENLWGISPMPMLNNTNECHGPGNKFSTAAFAQTPMLNNNNINVPISALAGTQSASTSPFEGQGNAHSAMPGFETKAFVDNLSNPQSDMKQYKELTMVAKEDDDMITNSVMPKKKSATKRSDMITNNFIPKKKSAMKRSLIETMQKKIIELEQELRNQKASMASMNVVPNNIVEHGQNSVETMSAFSENLWGKWPMPMLNDTNECHGPGNKFSQHLDMHRHLC